MAREAGLVYSWFTHPSTALGCDIVLPVCMAAVWESESTLVTCFTSRWHPHEKEKAPLPGAKLSLASGVLAGEQPHWTPWLAPLSCAQRVHLDAAAPASEQAEDEFPITQPGQSSEIKKGRSRGKREGGRGKKDKEQ